jgi:hypothetical protein
VVEKCSQLVRCTFPFEHAYIWVSDHANVVAVVEMAVNETMHVCRIGLRPVMAICCHDGAIHQISISLPEDVSLLCAVTMSTGAN